MTGMYPDADPTAPGGMSQQQLARELHDVHGWSAADLAQFRVEGQKKWRLDRWKVMIDTVCEERLAREQEKTPEQIAAEEQAKAEAKANADRAAAEAEQARMDEAAFLEDQEMRALDDLLAEFEEKANDLTGWAEVIEKNGQTQKAETRPPLFLPFPGVMDYMFDGHRGAGPSSAERWMNCTASLGAVRSFLETLTINQQYEFAASGLAARQGTTAHAVAETQARVILGEITPEEAEVSLLELTLDPDTEDESYSEEMEGYVSEYVSYVESYVNEGREVLIEAKVSAAIPLLTVDKGGNEQVYEITGALDLGVMPSPEFPVLVVGDLKYGEGIEVGVEENPQIRIYALALLALVVERYGEIPDWLERVEYAIIQPRLGGIKESSESVDDLLDWQENVLSKALTEALGGQREGAAFVPGEVQCQWCPVRGSCPALIEQRFSEAAEFFDTVIENNGEFTETTLLDNATLGKRYAEIDGLVKLHKELKAETQRRLYRGEHVPGFTLVNYSPPRHWTDADEAAEQIAEGIEGMTGNQQASLFTEPSLVSPTVAEKTLGEAYALVADLVTKPDKRPVVAREGDRRSKWEGKAPEDMFANEDEEQS